MSQEPPFVLGSGPEAIRVVFTSGSVQIRGRGLVIDGNSDFARVLRWVLSPSGAMAPAEPPSEAGLDIDDVVAVLRELDRCGLPAEVWGGAWQARLGTRSRPQ